MHVYARRFIRIQKRRERGELISLPESRCLQNERDVSTLLVGIHFHLLFVPPHVGITGVCTNALFPICTCNQSATKRLNKDIAFQRLSLNAERHHRSDRLFNAGKIDVTNEYTCPLASQALSSCRPNAGSSVSDDNCLSFVPFHRNHLRQSVQVDATLLDSMLSIQ